MEFAKDAGRTGYDSPREFVSKEDDAAKRAAAEVRRWVAELDVAERAFEGYHKRIDVITKRYRDEESSAAESRAEAKAGGDQRRYNALWSMKETLKPLLLDRAPTPYVKRAHDDDDPIARDAALIVQRALLSYTEEDEFFDALNEATDEYVLCGRGVTWVTYVPEFAVRESDVPTFVGAQEDVPVDPFSDDEAPYRVERDRAGKLFYREKIEYKSRESIVVESVNNKDYLHGACTKWRHVPWIARRVPMTRDELERRFGKEIGKKVPLNSREKDATRHSAANTADFEGTFSRAIVWEIWDRSKREIIWMSPDYASSVLDRKTDMLNLRKFYPCAKPMFGTMTNDTLVPIPDYTQWQDIALELDDVTHRISILTDALRVVGVYSEEYGTDLKKLLKGTKANDMIPVRNWAMFSEKGGLKGAVDFFPLDQVINTLNKLYEVRRQLVVELYEITGISDIVRGASDPRETAAAQKLKGSFANARLTSRQKCVARHARETLAIMAEIICTLYGDDELVRLSGAEQLFVGADGQFDVQRWQAVVALIRDEPLRMLRVRIDTENLANENITADREEATQFMAGLTGYLQSATAMLERAPMTGKLLGKLLLFAVRKFRVGRSLEAEIDSAIQQLMQTGLGQSQGEDDKPADNGMNEMEYKVEMERLALDRDRLQLDRDRLQLEREKLGIAQNKNAGDQAVRQRDAGTKEFKAKTDAVIKAREVEIKERQAGTQEAQLELRAAESVRQHTANDEDRAHARDMDMARFEAERFDSEDEKMHRAVEHEAAQRNASEDRKERARSTKRPKNKA